MADNEIQKEIKDFIIGDVLDRFLRYVQIDTTANPNNSNISGPSSAGQMTLLELLKDEADAMGGLTTSLDPKGYLYIKLPGNSSTSALGFLAHVDTSPDVSGAGVKPRVIEPYDGGSITYPDDPGLVLSPSDSPELLKFVGDAIVVASGSTLLGADDKAGVAAIMTALATWSRFPSLAHGDIVACFTRDEELGVGVDEIDLSKLPKFCFTIDGGDIGELEYECFDARSVKLTFRGIDVHPGYGKDKMVSAVVAASEFVSTLSPTERPDRTSGRDGFYHVTSFEGDVLKAEVRMILRDFDSVINDRREMIIRDRVSQIEHSYPGLRVELEMGSTYRNMRPVIDQHPEMLEIARGAIQDAELTVQENSIRGGTDGSKLSFHGHPTPNLFAGEYMIHSRREWTSRRALSLAVETILHLARRWTEGGRKQV